MFALFQVDMRVAHLVERVYLRARALEGCLAACGRRFTGVEVRVGHGDYGTGKMFKIPRKSGDNWVQC